MTGSSLFQKNLLYLDTAMPDVAKLVRATTDTITRPVAEGEGPALDIDLGSGRLYNRPATAFAHEQVGAWLARPDRVVVNRPEPEGLVDVCTQSLVSELSGAAGEALLPVPPKSHAGLLVVIGLGLGFHVRELVEQISPRHVVVIEPIEEFVSHSLHAVDWVDMVESCHARGATFDVIANYDPRAVQNRLEALITGFGASCMDGAYSFLHYQTDATRTIARGFRELAGMVSILQGYYADEKLMIENTIANVTGDEFWLIDGAFQAPHDIPAIIVGSGPSLDASLDSLRRWKDHAVIFCAGSSLQSLLAAGITPDFQVEKENNEITEARMAHIFERSGVEGDTFNTSLIGSTTVKPSVVGLFRDAFLFHRDLLSSTRMFGAGIQPVMGTGPFSANTAVAAATVLGFRRMYFFGCDCGSVDQDRHHAAETVYHTRQGHASAHFDMPNPVPANFGGQAWSNPYFLWSRWVFESMIANAGIDAVNCSDGVAIAGARPLQPELLEMSGRALDKANVVARIKSRTRHFAPGTYLAEQDVAGAVEHVHAFAGEVRAFLDGQLPHLGDLAEFEAALVQFLEKSDAAYGGAVVPLRGSMRAMVPVAGYFLNRAGDDEMRTRLMTVFRDCFRAQVERMLDDQAGMFDAIAAEHVPHTAMRAAG